MRSIALSIAILASAVMASAGTVTRNLAGARYNNCLDELGMTLAVVFSVLLAIDFVRGLTVDSSKRVSQPDSRCTEPGKRE